MARERIISADSHMTVRDEALFRHLPKTHQDQVRQLQQALQQGPMGKKDGLYAKATWAAWGRAGEWDPVERLKDMDIDKVDAEVIYSLPNAGTHFYPLKDGARVAAFEAFNNAALDFAAADPERLLPVYLLPIADVKEGVAEVLRLAGAGARAFMIPTFPADVGIKPYFDASWDPLWAAVQETSIPISQHLGGHSHTEKVRAYDQTRNKGIYRALSPIWMAENLAAWAMSGVLERFPGLRLIFVEAGLGWLPFFLERMDRTTRQIGWGPDVLPHKPSHYWRQNMAATFEEDEFGIKHRHIIGIGNLMWATDYPHPDSTWPRSQEVIRDHFEGVPVHEKRQIICGNAARLYRLA